MNSLRLYTLFLMIAVSGAFVNLWLLLGALTSFSAKKNACDEYYSIFAYQRTDKTKWPIARFSS